MRIFPELVTFEGGAHRIRDNPPLIYHMQGERRDNGQRSVREASRATASWRTGVICARSNVMNSRTSPGKWSGRQRWHPLASIMLIDGRADDPLFPASQGSACFGAGALCRTKAFTRTMAAGGDGAALMQVGSTDIFLGWNRDENGHFYIRQMTRHENQAAVLSCSGRA